MVQVSMWVLVRTIGLARESCKGVYYNGDDDDEDDEKNIVEGREGRQRPTERNYS